jgi:four helix bundle protein
MDEQAAAPPAAASKSAKIEERARQFALAVLRLVRSMPRDEGSRVVGRQLARCGTSIGANAEEAIGAFPRSEFTYHMNVAKREAREARYWLRLIADDGHSQKVEPLIAEVEELLRMLTSIVKTTRSRSACGPASG